MKYLIYTALMLFGLVGGMLLLGWGINEVVEEPLENFAVWWNNGGAVIYLIVLGVVLFCVYKIIVKKDKEDEEE